MIGRTPIRGFRSAAHGCVICLSLLPGRPRMARLPRLPRLARLARPARLAWLAWLAWLAVNVQVPHVHRVDVGLAEPLHRTEDPREVDRAGGVLAHRSRLDRGPRVCADGEDAVAAQQDRGRPVPGQGLDDRLADLVAADAGERRERDVAAELVGHGGEDAG